MIKQFLTDVAWGERDVLIIDTPPGTRCSFLLLSMTMFLLLFLYSPPMVVFSDEHITVMEALRGVEVEGAVLVTTPQVRQGDLLLTATFQAVAVGDVRRELTFCRKTGLKVGVVRMTGHQSKTCLVLGIEVENVPRLFAMKSVLSALY